jgi:hypothetical protein
MLARKNEKLASIAKFGVDDCLPSQFWFGVGYSTPSVETSNVIIPAKTIHRFLPHLPDLV